MNVIKQFICVADTVKSGLSCVLKVDDIKYTKVTKINTANIEYNTIHKNAVNYEQDIVFQILTLSVAEEIFSKLPEPEREFVEMSIAISDTVSSELYKDNIWSQTN